MILMLAFSNNSISSTPLCVAVNTSEGGDSFRFSICTYFRTIPMILFILVQFDILSSNQANTEFEQVLLTFTFNSCLISGSDSSKLDSYLFLKTKILQVAIGKLDHYTTSGPSLHLSHPDLLMHHQLYIRITFCINIMPLVSICVVMNQLHSACQKHFEPFAFIVDITKDKLAICPEVLPDTCHI